MKANPSQYRVPLVGLVILALLTFAACSRSQSDIVDEAKAAGKTVGDFPASSTDYFKPMDRVAEAPDPRTPTPTPKLIELSLSPEEIKGRNTWMLWCGGNEGFWDWLANNSYGFLDLLKLADFNPDNRWPRFAEAGLIVEPGTAIPSQPDEYGLWIRTPVNGQPPAAVPPEAVYGRSSGILGLRLFKNPRFDDRARRRWDAVKYYKDPKYYNDPNLIRPYRVGMACSFCHVGPHPLSPPANVEEPAWENLSATIGNQYMRIRKVFGNLLTDDNLVYHLLDSQPPGTIDTSLIVSDNINNPNTMNAVWEVGARLDRSGLFVHRSSQYAADYTQRYGTNPVETVGEAAKGMPVLLYDASYAYANPRPVPRILLDGSDSIGAWGALARVYLNIGTFYERWITLHNPLIGFRTQQPFKVKQAQQDSVYWQATDRMMDDVAKYFLKSSGPTRLRDAPGGRGLVKGSGVPWAPELAAGRKVFAEHCIVCHSSKQPKTFDGHPADRLLDLPKDPAYSAWAHAEVEKPDFWQENYLATDRRVPVTLIRTNAGRAMATNAIAGNMWEDFSSDTYKALPAVGDVSVWNPFDSTEQAWKAPAGGRGYYRPASLVSVWATAPLLHNNSLGIFNNDPSVNGRVAAFRDAIAKLLVGGANDQEAAAARWKKGSDLNLATPARLEKDHGLTWRTPRATWIRIPARHLPHLIVYSTGIPAAFVEHPWIAPLVVLAIAAVLVLRRNRWLRRLGYLVILLAALVGVVSYFAGGYIADLAIGPIPAGMPVSALTNLDPDPARAADVRSTLFRAIGIMREMRNLPPESNEARAKMNELGSALLKVSKSPDLVMDRGHYLGVGLTEREVEDLVDLLMTF